VIPLPSPALDERFDALAELALHGANLQPGQLLGVTAFIGQEELARAIARAAYRRGAAYVDVWYFDPWVKRARIEHADENTLDYVPPWLSTRLLTLAERNAARISFRGVVSPRALEGLDGTRLGRDQLPWLKESMQVMNERSTNWCVVPCPSREWAELVYGNDSEEAYERLWSDLWHILRLDEPDPQAAWDARFAELRAAGDAIAERRFDSIELHGPGTDLTVGLLPTSRWVSGDLETVTGIRHACNLPTEEVFTTPDPERVEGHVTATRPLVMLDGTVVRGLRVRFEAGRAVEIDADANVEVFLGKHRIDEGGTRLGELALVDKQSRIGRTGLVFYDTLLDENAVTHIAMGAGYHSAVDEADYGRVNASSVHTDFMIGSNELEVTGITASGERVPVLRDGSWRL
jgi:aminopeptidase